MSENISQEQSKAIDDLLKQAVYDNEFKVQTINQLKANLDIYSTHINNQKIIITEFQSKEEQYGNMDRTIRHYEAMINNSQNLLRTIFVNYRLGYYFLWILSVVNNPLYKAIFLALKINNNSRK